MHFDETDCLGDAVAEHADSIRPSCIPVPVLFEELTFRRDGARPGRSSSLTPLIDLRRCARRSPGTLPGVHFRPTVFDRRSEHAKQACGGCGRPQQDRHCRQSAVAILVERAGPLAVQWRQPPPAEQVKLPFSILAGSSDLRQDRTGLPPRTIYQLAKGHDQFAKDRQPFLLSDYRRSVTWIARRARN